MPSARLRSAARALRGAHILAGDPVARKYRLAGESTPDRSGQNKPYKFNVRASARQEDDKTMDIAAQQGQKQPSKAEHAKDAALAVLVRDWRERGLLLSSKNTEVVSITQLLQAQRPTLPWVAKGGWLAEASTNALLQAFAKQEMQENQWHQQIVESKPKNREELSTQLHTESKEPALDESAAVAEAEWMASLGGALSAFGMASVVSLADIVKELEQELEVLTAENEINAKQRGVATRRIARAKKLSDTKALANEQQIDKDLRIRCHVIQTALPALHYLLRLCAESERRQTHLSLPELEREICRLDSVANYDTTGDGAGATLLHVAAESGNSELMSEVLRKEHGVDSKRLDGTTPLYAAARLGQVDAAAWLLVNGADVNLQRRDGCTPLLAATAAGNLEMLRHLCKSGANLMHAERNGISALVFVAARVEHKRLTKKRVAMEVREEYLVKAEALRSSGDTSISDLEALGDLAGSLSDKVNHSKLELKEVEPALCAVLSMATVCELYRRAALKDWKDAVALRKKRSAPAKRLDAAAAVDPITLPLSPKPNTDDPQPLSPLCPRHKGPAAEKIIDGPGGIGADLLGPTDLCKVLQGWGCFHMNKADAKVLASKLVSPGAGEGVARAGFEQTFLWWWQWDRSSAAQREATSMSHGPGTGALPMTEEERAASQVQQHTRSRSVRRRRDAALARLSSPRLVADTSVIAYCDAQRWIVQACADSLRCMGCFPSMVAVLERLRRKVVVEYQEAMEQMRQVQRRNRHGSPADNLPTIGVTPSAAATETLDGQGQQNRHRMHKRLAATAIQHKAVGAFKQEGKKLLSPISSGTSLPAIL
eukprot:COSAG02_NODE_4843_length_4914_cov_3.780893_3_plen_830_part_00